MKLCDDLPFIWEEALSIVALKSKHRNLNDGQKQTGNPWNSFKTNITHSLKLS